MKCRTLFSSIPHGCTLAAWPNRCNSASLAESSVAIDELNGPWATADRVVPVLTRHAVHTGGTIATFGARQSGAGVGPCLTSGRTAATEPAESVRSSAPRSAEAVPGTTTPGGQCVPDERRVGHRHRRAHGVHTATRGGSAVTTPAAIAAIAATAAISTGSARSATSGTFASTARAAATTIATTAAVSTGSAGSAGSAVPRDADVRTECRVADYRDRPGVEQPTSERRAASTPGPARRARATAAARATKSTAAAARTRAGRDAATTATARPTRAAERRSRAVQARSACAAAAPDPANRAIAVHRRVTDRDLPEVRNSTAAPDATDAAPTTRATVAALRPARRASAGSTGSPGASSTLRIAIAGIASTPRASAPTTGAAPGASTEAADAARSPPATVRSIAGHRPTHQGQHTRTSVVNSAAGRHAASASGAGATS